MVALNSRLSILDRGAAGVRHGSAPRRYFTSRWLTIPSETVHLRRRSLLVRGVPSR